MKILYAIQGNGNGFINRAKEIIPLLQKKCEVDVLVSGTPENTTFPFEVNYHYQGLNFIYGKKENDRLWNSYIKANKKILRKDINDLPIKDYNFVINDFEPVSAWACYYKKIPCISLSHQCSLLDKNVPKPSGKDFVSKYLIRNYAPSIVNFGYHYCKYSKSIYTPIIRKEIREAKASDMGYYAVYLPSFKLDEAINILKEFNETRWQVFSKQNDKAVIEKNLEIYPLTNDGFTQSLITCTGILCEAEFEVPAEAMFLGKKLMIIPLHSHYEQQCNAVALKGMGIPVIKKMKDNNLEKIGDWLDSDYKIEISYPDITDKIINKIFETHVQDILKKNFWDKKYKLTISKKQVKYP